MFVFGINFIRLLSCSKYALSFDPQNSDELLYGRAGYLYALLFVRKNLPSRHIPESLIVQVSWALYYYDFKMLLYD